MQLQAMLMSTRTSTVIIIIILEYRLVGMRLLHVHQLFDPVLDRTNQTHP